MKIGIIEGLIVGKDGHVRGVNLRVSALGKPQFCFKPVQRSINWKYHQSAIMMDKEGLREVMWM